VFLDYYKVIINAIFFTAAKQSAQEIYSRLAP